MNIVILSGKIQDNIKFNFIYDNLYTSISRGKIILNDENIISIYGYDDIADVLYRSEGKYIWAVGEVKKDGIEIKEIYKNII